MLRVPEVIWRGLLADRGLEPLDLVVYLAAWSGGLRGIADLAAKVQVNRDTAGRSCARLLERGWLQVVRSGSYRCPAPLIPRSCQLEVVRQLLADAAMAPYLGEFVMRRYLDLRVTSDNFIDNARPLELTNPLTDERLEMDRLYLDTAVGFEFNGPQHYKQTRRYADERSLKAQRTRDILKRGLSLEAHFTLVVVTIDQLHPAILDTLIPPRLERRPIDVDGPYHQALVELGITCVNEARSWTA